MSETQSRYNPLASVLRLLTVFALSMLVAGCSWFSWIPGIGDNDQDDESKASRHSCRSGKLHSQMEGNHGTVGQR